MIEGYGKVMEVSIKELPFQKILRRFEFIIIVT